MKSKSAYVVALVLFLVFNVCLIATVNSQDTEVFMVLLNSPANGSTINTFACTFTYTPVLIGNDSYLNAFLVINGTQTSATNQAAIQNNTINQISYTFADNGTYQWNIIVYDNNSHHAFATTDYTLTVTVLPTPTPTPTPTATPENTPAPTLTATPTPSASPSPEPTPTETPIPTPEPPAVDDGSVLAIGLVVLAVVLALVVVFLWRASR